MLKNETSNEIVDLISAIETAKEELNDAEYKVKFLPGIINNLEKKLFKIIQEECKNNVCCE